MYIFGCFRTFFGNPFGRKTSFRTLSDDIFAFPPPQFLSIFAPIGRTWDPLVAFPVGPGAFKRAPIGSFPFPGPTNRFFFTLGVGQCVPGGMLQALPPQGDVDKAGVVGGEVGAEAGEGDGLQRGHRQTVYPHREHTWWGVAAAEYPRCPQAA